MATVRGQQHTVPSTSLPSAFFVPERHVGGGSTERNAEPYSDGNREIFFYFLFSVSLLNCRRNFVVVAV